MSIYGCPNMPRPAAYQPLIVQDGYHEYREGPDQVPVKRPRYKEINGTFGDTACQYTREHATDPQCSGCVHRAKDGAQAVAMKGAM